MLKPRLLVVEDEPQIASMLARIAEEEGFETRIAVGNHAIEKACEHFRPDVITLDVIMPDMDGLEVLQLLHRNFSEAKIVILSGSEELARRLAESLGKALGLTIVANLTKPFRIAPMRLLFRKLKDQSSDLHFIPQKRGTL